MFSLFLDGSKSIENSLEKQVQKTSSERIRKPLAQVQKSSDKFRKALKNNERH
jgi:hypothetical protein